MPLPVIESGVSAGTPMTALMTAVSAYITRSAGSTIRMPEI